MASTQNDSGEAQQGKPKSRAYKRENSLYINVGDNKAVKPTLIIDAISSVCGEGELYACVPKSGNMYIVTMKNKDMCNMIADGIECRGKTYNCSYVVKDTLNVSVMGVDPCIEDYEVADALEAMDATVMGEVSRLTYPGTNVENGNRLCRVRLPKTMASLPYCMRLSNGAATDSYRILHDDQKKLCNKCHSPNHLFKDCPKFVCYRCNVQGHFKSQCTAVWCQECYSYQCECESEENDESNTENDDEVNKCQTGKTDKQDVKSSELCDKCGQIENCVCANIEEDETDDDIPTAENEAVYGDFVDMTNNEAGGVLPENPTRNIQQAENVSSLESDQQQDNVVEMVSPRILRKRSNAEGCDKNSKFRVMEKAVPE